MICRPVRSRNLARDLAFVKDPHHGRLPGRGLQPRRAVTASQLFKLSFQSFAQTWGRRSADNGCDVQGIARATHGVRREADRWVC